MKRIIAACLLLLALTSQLFAADTRAAGETFARTYDTKDFKVNQDSVKQEMPVNGAYKVAPRRKGLEVWSSFTVPDDASDLLEWTATAVVLSSEGATPGVALLCGGGVSALFVAPDGSGSLRRYDGKKTVWSSEFKIENFSYPADLTIHRDCNGSIEARVDGAIVALELAPYAVGRPKTERVSAVSFATMATSKAGEAAVYERLEVTAKGKRDFDSLFKTE